MFWPWFLNSHTHRGRPTVNALLIYVLGTELHWIFTHFSPPLGTRYLAQISPPGPSPFPPNYLKNTFFQPFYLDWIVFQDFSKFRTFPQRRDTWNVIRVEFSRGFLSAARWRSWDICAIGIQRKTKNTETPERALFFIFFFHLCNGESLSTRGDFFQNVQKALLPRMRGNIFVCVSLCFFFLRNVTWISVDENSVLLRACSARQAFFPNFSVFFA